MEGPAVAVVAEEVVDVDAPKFLVVKETAGEATCLPLPLRAALVTADSDVLSVFIVLTRNGG